MINSIVAFIFMIIMYIAGVIIGYTLSELKNRNKSVTEFPKVANNKTIKKVKHNFDNPLQPFKEEFQNNKKLYEPVKPQSGLKIEEGE